MHTFRYNVLSLHIYVSFGLMAVGGGGGDRTNCYYTNPSKFCLATRLEQHMEGVSTLVLVPAPARLIYTPLVKPKWAQALQTYPLKSLAELCFQALLSASALDTTTLKDLSEVHTRT